MRFSRPEVFSAQHHRAFWVHWEKPYSNSLSKARDPFINDWTLIRLLRQRPTHFAALTNILNREKISLRLALAVLMDKFEPGIKIEVMKKVFANSEIHRSFFRWLNRQSDGFIAECRELWREARGISSVSREPSRSNDYEHVFKNMSQRGLRLFYSTGQGLELVGYAVGSRRTSFLL